MRNPLRLILAVTIATAALLFVDGGSTSIAEHKSPDLSGLPDSALKPSAAVGDDRAGTAAASLAGTCTPDLLWQFDGSQVNGGLGEALSGAGDFDGDGFDDFMFGSSQLDVGSRRAKGTVWIFSGQTGAQIRQINGSAAYDRLGLSISEAGDVNGDGFDDVIIGIPRLPYNDDTYGLARVYLGPSGIWGWQLDATEDIGLGRAVSGAGDVDNDGYDDVIVGCSHDSRNGTYWAGSASVYSPHKDELLWRFHGVGHRDFFGSSVDGAGDVNGDGYDDLIVGAPDTYQNEVFHPGSAFVYSGQTGALLYQYSGPPSGGGMGGCVAGAGDVNNDGFDDFIISEPSIDNYQGKAYVRSGQNGALLHVFDCTGVGSHITDGAGDVDGDGFDDVIIGSPWDAPVGSASVYSGQTGDLIMRIDGAAQEDGVGYEVAGAGDTDGDGHDDIILSASHADPFGINRAGQVFVYRCPADPCDIYGDYITEKQQLISDIYLMDRPYFGQDRPFFETQEQDALTWLTYVQDACDADNGTEEEAESIARLVLTERVSKQALLDAIEISDYGAKGLVSFATSKAAGAAFKFFGKFAKDIPGGNYISQLLTRLSDRCDRGLLRIMYSFNKSLTPPLGGAITPTEYAKVMATADALIAKAGGKITKKTLQVLDGGVHDLTTYEGLFNTADNAIQDYGYLSVLELSRRGRAV